MLREYTKLSLSSNRPSFSGMKLYVRKQTFPFLFLFLTDKNFFAESYEGFCYELILEVAKILKYVLVVTIKEAFILLTSFS